MKLIADRDYRVPSGCSVVGMMSEDGNRFTGEAIIKSIPTMRERSNGLGGGFAAYGIYPEYPDYYAFHIMFESSKAKEVTEDYLKKNYTIEKDEPIPTRSIEAIKYQPLLWRYFVKVNKKEKENHIGLTEEDFVVKTVMEINANIEDAFVSSSGKNMGIFKGVGYPEDIGVLHRLEEYEGYIWTSHGRFPTNTVGWWGGAHPFGLLDWSIVHNGEISSYGINKRYLFNFDYNCSLFTDTEVVTYLFDLLIRKHKLSFEIAAKVLAPPFWDEIERMPEELQEIAKAIRITYGSALLNGPFGVILGHRKGMIGLNDRVKLRPLVAARNKDMLYLASEESAIREICSTFEKVWSPKAGEPIIGRLKEN